MILWAQVQRPENGRHLMTRQNAYIIANGVRTSLRARLDSQNEGNVRERDWKSGRLPALQDVLQESPDNLPYLGGQVVRRLLQDVGKTAGVPRVEATLRLTGADVPKSLLELTGEQGAPATVRENHVGSRIAVVLAALLKVKSLDIAFESAARRGGSGSTSSGNERQKAVESLDTKIVILVPTNRGAVGEQGLARELKWKVDRTEVTNSLLAVGICIQVSMLYPDQYPLIYDSLGNLVPYDIPDGNKINLLAVCIPLGVIFCIPAVVMGAFKLKKMLDETMKKFIPSWDHGQSESSERKLSAFEVFADIGHRETFEPEGRKMGLPSSPSDTAATAATNKPQRPASSFRFEDVEERILQRTIALQKTKIEVPILGTSVEFLQESEKRDEKKEEEKRMQEEEEKEKKEEEEVEQRILQRTNTLREELTTKKSSFVAKQAEKERREELKKHILYECWAYTKGEGGLLHSSAYRKWYFVVTDQQELGYYEYPPESLYHNRPEGTLSCVGMLVKQRDGTEAIQGKECFTFTIQAKEGSRTSDIHCACETSHARQKLLATIEDIEKISFTHLKVLPPLREDEEGTGEDLETVAQMAESECYTEGFQAMLAKKVDESDMLAATLKESEEEEFKALLDNNQNFLSQEGKGDDKKMTNLAPEGERERSRGGGHDVVGGGAFHLRTFGDLSANCNSSPRSFTSLHPFASPRSHRARTSSANPLDAPESGDNIYRLGSINQLQGSSNTLHSGATTCFAGTKVQILTQKAPAETRTYEGERLIWRTSSEGERLTGRSHSYVRRRINADHPDGNDVEECQNPFSLAKAWHKERATALIHDIIQNQAEKERELRSEDIKSRFALSAPLLRRQQQVSAELRSENL